MNKSIVFLAFLFLISIISCKNDDDTSTDDSVVLETAILGKWLLVASAENGVPDDLNTCDLMDFYEFRANKTVIFAENGDSGGTCVTFENSGTWSIEGDVLITEIGEREEETIKELTETTLVLESTDGSDTYTDTYEKE